MPAQAPVPPETRVPAEADRLPVTAPELLDRANPEAEIARAARAYSNWGRWGADDVLGTVNFITDELRLAAAGLVRRGASFSLSQRFDMDGPQRGWRRRTNPVHTMLDTGTDAVEGNQGFPHGIGGADDVIAMPLQCSTQWDGLGHIFDHGKAWNGRNAAKTVTSDGDLVTGIERLARPVCGRGVLLDVGRVIGPALATSPSGAGAAGTGTDPQYELPDGFAITTGHLTATAAAHGVTVRRGDLLLVRTGRYARALREGWGEYAGGASPGLSFTTAGWLHRTEIAAVATDTWGFEVRPNEFDDAFQPLHQVAIPNMGLLIGEMWALEELAADCAADGVYEFFLTAAPLPVTGAVGSPVNPIAVK
jgi:kynurenine formamidase